MLSAASLMVAGAAAGEAVAIARRWPTLRVGLHLVMVEGRPALAPRGIPDLVGADGWLRTDLAALGLDIAARPRLRRQLAAEIAAQFEAFRATGLPLDHVNAHKHFHLHPVVGAMVIAIGRRFGMRALRVPFEPTAVLARAEPGPRGPTTERLLARMLRFRARRSGLTIPEAVFGLAWSGAMTAGRLAALIRESPPGLVEIYTHPATAIGYEGYAPGYRPAEELAALCDPAVVEAARASGARLGGYAAA